MSTTVVMRRVCNSNIFETDDWMNYDYQEDLATDSELSELTLVGKEIID